MPHLRLWAIQAALIFFSATITSQALAQSLSTSLELPQLGNSPNATARDVSAMLQMKGHEVDQKVSDMGNPLLIVKAPEFKYAVIFYNCASNVCDGVQFRAFFSKDAKFTTELLNDYNRTKRHGRAYLDSDRDPTIELNIEMRGGVTPEQLSYQHDLFLEARADFRAHLVAAKDAPSAAGSPGTALCGEGVEAAPTWQGEYPMPVVDVQRAVSLPYRAEPCGPIVGQCEVPAGLYHPWAGGTGFSTIRHIARYRVTRDLSDPDMDARFSEGDIVEVTAYLGEGFCAFRVNGTKASGYCPDMLDESAFEALNPGADQLPEVQLFQVSCGGQPVWIDASTALGSAGVEEGVITGYGEVAPHGAEGVF